MNLDLAAFALSLGALGEVGDHTEATTRVLDEPDRGSPSLEIFFGWPLGFYVKVFLQIIIHASMVYEMNSN